jgi:hydroxypyruvate reductase
MNGLRRRLTRWGNGRLAAALGDREVTCWLISDVVGNALEVVGSGPLLVDAGRLDDVLALVSHPILGAALPPRVHEALQRPPGAPTGRKPIPHHIVADGPMAANAAALAARAAGLSVTVHQRPIVGDANAEGAGLAKWILSEMKRHRLPRPGSAQSVEPVPRAGVLHVWHGETTVALPPVPGRGGRAQQLALAVAHGLAGTPHPDDAVVLVAGTDGVDGNTDAAGAVIDAGTARRIASAGLDVMQSLRACDASSALAKVDALVRTGPTGTNVADLLLVRMWNWY